MQRTIFATAGALALSLAPCAAQEQQPIPFEGGLLTITEEDDFSKVLAFDGRELARDYFIFYDRTVEVAGSKVALFELADGGNACGTTVHIVWRPEGGEVEAVSAGEDCGSPPAAVTANAIYFVPFLIPGESSPVRVWSPESGMRLAGELHYAPQPGTGWRDLDAAAIGHIMDAFQNEAVYDAASKLLGGALGDVATGLIVSGGVETLASGTFYSSGCVPHACGSADAFMAVDANRQQLYFAQQQDGPLPLTWPAAATWPRQLRAAMTEALAR